MQIKRCGWSHTWGYAKQPSAWSLLFILGMGLALIGCAKPQIAYTVASPPPCQKPAPAVTYEAFPLQLFLPLPLQVLEEKFRHEPFDILEAKATARGSTSAVTFRIQFRDCTVVQVKWRAAPPTFRRFNNDPRREIASYHFQKLFLAPEEYVVPVTTLICIPQADLVRIGLDIAPQIAGAECVFGPVAIWLQHVKVKGNFLDRERFARSATGEESRDYARQFANLNLFTTLISHRDGRKGNFLISAVPAQPHTFSIDNSLAYEGMGNPRIGIPQWGYLKVDTLPRATVEQLRRITPEQLQRELGVVDEYRVMADGHVQPLRPFSPNINPQQGFRRKDTMVQIGLTEREIAKIAARLRTLLERVDRGEIQLF